MTFARTPDGVSTQVYRVHRGEQVFYLRLAEEEDETLAVDAELYRRLRRLGALVPEVIYLEPFDQAIRRSGLITAEIPGASLEELASTDTADSVARDAGRDLALINQLPVEGFGWVRRDNDAWPLTGELSSYGEFVTSYLPEHWPGDLALLFSAAEVKAMEAIIETERGGGLARGRLPHGDFDLTAIFQEEGRYTGLIDFGEIRGAEPSFDLGHFHLHDSERYPTPSWTSWSMDVARWQTCHATIPTPSAAPRSSSACASFGAGSAPGADVRSTTPPCATESAGSAGSSAA